MNTKIISRFGKYKFILLGVIFGLFCLGIALRKETAVARGTPIVYDDFAFSVKDVQTSPAHDPDSDRERLMTVTLEIANRARRVSYTFHPGHMVVTDKSGTEYRLDPIQQRKLDESSPSRTTQQPPISAGKSATFDLVFRVPATLKHPRMRLSSGGPVGDFLESMTAGSKSFDLEN